MTLVANSSPPNFKAMHIKIKEELTKQQQEHREQMAEQEAQHNIALRTWLKQEPKPPEAKNRPKIENAAKRAVVQKTTPQAAIILYIILSYHKHYYYIILF